MWSQPIGHDCRVPISLSFSADGMMAFSETPYSVPLERNIIKTIPDVESSDGSRVFNNGVGTISQEIVHRIWDVLPITKAAPTTFQIQLQGAKGMLALNSRLPASLPLVYLRQ